MLDGHTYRLAQSLAQRQLETWRLAQFHSVIFGTMAFPNGTHSLSELWQILDTMQEHRFRSYMNAMGGLTNEECDFLVEALVDILVFQRTFMPDVPARIPYSTMMSTLSLYTKLRSLRPDFDSILEIGPGCGFLSLFLKSHPGLRNYVQIEACEAFYLLQNAIDCFSFPARMDERAFPQRSPGAANPFTTDTHLVEEIDVVADPLAPLCTHIPWWRLGDVAHGTAKFDIVTTNATMREMNEQALVDYLALVGRVMKDDALLVSQCLGGEIVTQNDQLRVKLYQAGFAPLMYIEQRGIKTIVDPLTGREAAIGYPVSFGIFVKQGHPLFKKYYFVDHYAGDFIAGENLVLRTFLRTDLRRTVYDQSQLREMVTQRFAARLAGKPADRR